MIKNKYNYILKEKIYIKRKIHKNDKKFIV